MLKNRTVPVFLICIFVMLILLFPIEGYTAVNSFSYDMGFETGPSNADINETDWGNVPAWYYKTTCHSGDFGAGASINTILEDVTPEVKFGYRNQEYGDLINYAFGVETWLNMHTIGLRFGFNKNEIAFGTSFEKYLGSVGFRIDYAALISMSIGNNSGSHRISTSVKF